MAKSSSASKGYRKQQKKKPFLTRNELIAAIVIVVVFILAMIVVTNEDMLFRLFPDGNIAASDVKKGDIVSFGKDSKTRYFKVGEIGELEGYTCEPSTNSKGVDTSYILSPEDEASNVVYVTLSGSAIEASTLPDSYREQSAALGASIVFTDTVTSEVQGHKAYLFSYTRSYYDANKVAEDSTESTAEVASAEDTAAEQTPNVYEQVFTAYIDADGEHTVCLHVTCHFDSADQYVPEDQVEAFIMNFTNFFTIIDMPAAK